MTRDEQAVAVTLLINALLIKMNLETQMQEGVPREQMSQAKAWLGEVGSILAVLGGTEETNASADIEDMLVYAQQADFSPDRLESARARIHDIGVKVAAATELWQSIRDNPTSLHARRST